MTETQNNQQHSDDEDEKIIKLVETEYERNPTFIKLNFHLLNPHHIQLICAHRILTPPVDVECTIKYLDLSGNQVRNEGCKYISQVLSNNTSIEVLNLSMNDISSSGVKFLCEVLSNKQQPHIPSPRHHRDSIHSNQSSTSTNNNSNSNSSVVTSKKKNETLKHLDLSMNRLGHEGVECLSQMLRNNHSLVTLSVRSNKIKNQEGVNHLLEMLATCSSNEILQEVFV